MNFSLMTYTVGPGWPGGCQSLEAMAGLAVELGFTALELSAGDLEERSPQEFGSICRDHGLAVSCINGGCNLADPDESEFLQGLDQCKYYVDLAVELDCKIIMPIPGHAADVDDKPRAAARIAEGLAEAVAYAAQAGVLVTLEDFPNLLSPYGSIAEMTAMLGSVPGLRLTFDNGNWMLSGDDPLQALQALGQHVVNAHLKDWEVNPEQTGMQLPDGRYIRGGLHGQGLIEHKPILAALQAMDYQGYLAFEYEGPMDHVAATRQGMAYLRQVLAELG
jgi:sugar phosphate isomerase/epimerase